MQVVTLIACLGSKRLTLQVTWEGSRSQSPDFLAMVAQVRLFCTTKSKVVWETRNFRDYKHDNKRVTMFKTTVG